MDKRENIAGQALGSFSLFYSCSVLCRLFYVKDVVNEDIINRVVRSDSVLAGPILVAYFYLSFLCDLRSL